MTEIGLLVPPTCFAGFLAVAFDLAMPAGGTSTQSGDSTADGWLALATSTGGSRDGGVLKPFKGVEHC
jgi:hypothetical protein